MAREWLKNLRAERGLTMRQAAELMGITDAYYCLIEQGTRQSPMDIPMAERLATAFHVPLLQVVTAELGRQ